MDVNDKFREKQRRRYFNMRMIKDVVMSVIILTIGLTAFFGKSFFQGMEPVYLNLFGCLCLVYGSFRMYIAIKRRY